MKLDESVPIDNAPVIDRQLSVQHVYHDLQQLYSSEAKPPDVM